MIVLSIVLFIQQPAATAPARRAPQGSVEVIVALVGQDLQVRPVPLFTLRLASRSDTTFQDSMRTSLDGRASRQLPVGSYLVRSSRAATLNSVGYSWTIPFDVAAGQATRLELSNANADSTAVVTSGRQIAPEILVYERVKRGVLRVSSGLGHGSGFLLDTLGGVLVTNDHVVAGGQAITVTVDSSLRLPARLVVSDRDADLAILTFDIRFCENCPRLRLATPDSTGKTVVPGERVIAVGFPLSQQSTVTSGIVSGVRESAIISDVNINHGNSGGPLLNLDGEVVGVNAFAEMDRGGGPGVSGSISVNRLGALLRRATDTISFRPFPEGQPLPVASTRAYPLALIRGVADTAWIDGYRGFEFGVGDFTVTVGTPVSQFVSFRAYEEEMSRDRRKREQRAGLSEAQRYSEFGQLHDWIQYVGDFTTAAIVVEFRPKIGETTGSLFARAFVSSRMRAKFVFKGDFHDAVFYRNGEPLIPLIGGRAPQTVFEQNQWVVMKDVAYRGYFVLPPEAFAPDSDGTPPSIVFRIDDLKHYDRFILRELPAAVVARVWNDFGPYYARTGRESSFTWANPAKFRSTFSRLCNASELCSGMQAFERPSQQQPPN
jgi:S1-C subfamily serine protease